MVAASLSGTDGDEIGYAPWTPCVRRRYRPAVPSRPGLDPTRIHAIIGDSLWRDLRVLDHTGSTNADLVALAEAGAPEGTVVVTDDQRRGRGRLTRRWVLPAGAGIALSALLRPASVPRQRWSWLPLVAGIAVADALREFGLRTRLKWPNDVLVNDRKIAGILVELADRGTAGVVGIGINVNDAAADLPPESTSIEAAAGVTAELSSVVTATLERLEVWYGRWRTSAYGGDLGTDPVAAEYAARSSTLGSEVVVTLPNGETARGVATAIDTYGALILATDHGVRTLAAGDVVHLR
jgi:BirA family biotin operon repressor/biotin-[acetyl-CoA-carboxylase] ligase